MKAFLMYQGRDLDLQEGPLSNEEALVQDLELATLFAAMAGGERFVWEVVARVMLSTSMDPAAIRYRQQVLADCLDHPAIVREMYDITVASVEEQRKSYFSGFRDSPDANLRGALGVLRAFLPSLRRLRDIAAEGGEIFRSPGFVRFFTMLSDELSADYLETVEHHLREVDPGRGVLLRAVLGKVNEKVDYLVLRPRPSGLKALMPPWTRSAGSFEISPRDDAGCHALTQMRGQGINQVANALAQSAEHIRSFFRMLRTELAFYIGCLNLHDRLGEKGEPTCFPDPSDAADAQFSAIGLYDICLALSLTDRVVGNDVGADGKRLVMITGANQGGKSTLLRSVGLAQLMMQCGMFVPAEALRASVSRGVFTHFKREEDRTMEKGKLEEELNRMSGIAEIIGPDCLLLCNESFASTNEREGSEIARQVVGALTEAGVRVFYVTHLYDLASNFHAQRLDDALFLRAERQSDGQRTFKLHEGEPLPTSFGEDVYRRVFGATDGAPAAAAGAMG